MTRTEAQLRADAITFLRTANFEQVSTFNLRWFADHLQLSGAKPREPAPKPPVKP